MAEDAPKVNITVNLDGVAGPAERAAVLSKEIVDFYFASLEAADLSKRPEPPSGRFFNYQLNAPEMTAEQRRSLHESWILSKAFQDLMRGVRGSLEEAFFVSELVAAGQIRAPSSGTLAEVLQPYKDKAIRMKFPPLLAAVNSRLEQPLEFSEAYKSMQAARNCFEHRDGVVGAADARDGRMILKFPRIKMFVVRKDEEIEITEQFAVEGGESIMVKIELRQREFAIGDKLLISASDFDEIAVACSQFGGLLAQSLSKKLVPGQTTT